MTQRSARARASSAVPSHRRQPARPPLRAPRFGLVALVTAALLGLGTGAGAGMALGAVSWPGTGGAGDALASSGLEAEVVAPSAKAPSASPSAPASAPVPSPTPVPEPVVVDPDAVDAAGLTAADRSAGLLSRVVPDLAGGDLVVVLGSQAAPVPSVPVKTVRVEVEAGLDVDGALFAATVMGILNDPHGWGADGSVSFARTDGPADLRVVLASPETVDVLCAPLTTAGKYSCASEGHAAINYLRWVEATPEFADRTQYRQYVINHEVGHLLGHRHVDCPAAGTVAPIMQQQSVSVAPCIPNGWPFPDAG